MLGRRDKLAEEVSEDQLKDYTDFVHDYGLYNSLRSLSLANLQCRGLVLHQDPFRGAASLCTERIGGSTQKNECS